MMVFSDIQDTPCAPMPAPGEGLRALPPPQGPGRGPAATAAREPESQAARRPHPAPGPRPPAPALRPPPRPASLGAPSAGARPSARSPGAECASAGALPALVAPPPPPMRHWAAPRTVSRPGDPPPGRKCERLTMATAAEQWVLVEMVQALYEVRWAVRVARGHPRPRGSGDSCGLVAGGLGGVARPGRGLAALAVPRRRRDRPERAPRLRV